jgi:hypothetical protein
VTNWADLFYYDETSPSCLRWKVERTCGKGRVHVLAGDPAGSPTANGYWQVEVGDTGYLCHRIVLELFGNVVDGLFVDHIDHDRFNNRIGNLRAVSRSLNNRNSLGRCDNTSGVVGVSRHVIKDKYHYWTAEYSTLEGKSVKMSFSVNKLGEQHAFDLACKARKEAVDKLNAEGAGYTPDHGQPKGETNE